MLYGTMSSLFGFFLCEILLIAGAYSSAESLSAYPKLLNKSGDTVTLEWKGIASPSELDFVAIYSPFDSPDEYYIGYKFLSSDPGWQTGSGRISIPLVNLRSDYSFRVFRWSKDEINYKKKDHDGNPLPRTAHLLARSDRVGFDPDACRVEQIHLAFTHSVGEMRVTFIAPDANPRRVMWRKEGSEWEYAETEKACRYEREDMCDAPANSSVGWRDPGWIHGAVMRPLEGGVRYHYKIGREGVGWSTLRSFVSRNGGSDDTVAFLFGDMGTSTPYSTYYRTQDESISTMKWILRDIKLLGDKPSFISHIGDISYARGYAWIWDHFFTLIEPAASSAAYHVCIGNHEYDWPLQPWKPDWAQGIYGKDGGGECGVPYSLKFKMPGNSSEPTGTRSPDTRNLYYSFNEGAVHFVYISTETNFEEGSKQHEFIKHDLEAVNRSATPFVVVQGHRPMYTTSNEIRDGPIRKKMMEHLEPLFARNNVTLALWGHVHRYERFCPMNNFECGRSWKGHPINIVIGMAGQDWQPMWEPRADHLDTPIYPQPVRSMYRGGEFGYTRLVANKEKLVFSYVGNHDGEVHDSVEIHASGEVVSGTEVKPVYAVRDTRSWWGGVLVVFGVVFGYVLGFVSRRKRDWAPVKNEEM